MRRLSILLDDRFIYAFAREVTRTGDARGAFPPYDAAAPYASTIATAHSKRLKAEGVTIFTTPLLARQGLETASAELVSQPSWPKASVEAAQALRALFADGMRHVSFTSSLDIGGTLASAITQLGPDLVISDNRAERAVMLPRQILNPLVISPRAWLRLAAALAR